MASIKKFRIDEAGSVVAVIPPRNGLRFFALALCGFCPFLAVYITQPLLPALAQTFSVSESGIGLTVTATTIAGAITAPFIGLLGDAVGRKPLIVASIFGLAVPTALAATATSLEQLIAWRFLQGLFIPGIFSIALAYIAEEWRGENLGSATSAYIAGNVFGSVSGRVVAGLVATYAGWRGSFLVLAGVLLAGGAAVWALLPPSLQHAAQHGGMRARLRALRSHFTNGRLIAVYAVGFNTLFVFVAVFTYITFHLSRPPFSLSPTALASMFLLNLFGAVATPFAGRWMDKVGYRTGLMAALITGATGILLTLSAHLAIVFLGLALVSTGVFVSNAAASSQLALVAGRAKGSAAGLYVCAYYAGGSLGAVVPGLVYAFGRWPACAALLLAVQLLSAIVALHYLKRELKRR